MGQIHPGFIADMLKHCERGEHPPLTVWEAQQLLTLAQRALAASPAPAPQEPVAHAHVYSSLCGPHDDEEVMRVRVVFVDPHWQHKQKDGATVPLYASPAPGELGAVDAAAWLPIETAPKDGAWVLVYWPTIPISLYPFCAFYDEGWQHPSFRDYGEVFPTHWMPLPQPPQQAPSESIAQGSGGEKV